ncbi:MAG: hypothetical protein ACKOCE_00355 [Acidimicrobiia bacterium]
MKINHNNRLITSGLAALAVAGLSFGVSACFDNGANVAQSDITTATATGEASKSDTSQTPIDADDHRSSDVVASDRRETDTDTHADTNSATTDLDVRPTEESPVTDSPTTPASETPAAGTEVVDGSTADTPATDTPATDAPASDTPASDAPVEIPSGDTAPGTGGAPTLEIPLNPGATAELILFVGTNGDLDASLFLKESGFGGNDIVSVKLVYYVGDTKTTTGATLSRETSNIRSIWKAKNMNLSSGDSVSVRITNSKGVTTYIDKVVEITAAV